MPASFTHKIAARSEDIGSLVCVGLDPDVSRMPGAYANLRTADALRIFCVDAVDATAEHAACFKPNAAFFEQYGPEGMAALKDVIAHARRVAPVILDAKRGDLGNTASAYARAVFDVLGADAVTLSPYMGKDSVDPFLGYADKGVFLLARTSNPGGADFQDLPDAKGVPLWQRVAEKARTWNERGNVGLVVGATRPEELERAREIAGEDAWFLVPGVGAQGGSPEDAVKRGGNARGSRVLVNASRGILYAGDGTPEAQARACRELKDALNAHRPA